MFQQLEDNFRQRFSYSKFFWKNKLENTRFNLSVIKRFVHQNNFLYSFPNLDGIELLIFLFLISGGIKLIGNLSIFVA